MLSQLNRIPSIQALGLAQEIAERVQRVHSLVGRGPVDGSQLETLTRAIEERLNKFPTDRASLSRIAKHEAGHFICGYVSGLVPTEAKVWRIPKPLGPSAWSGKSEFRPMAECRAHHDAELYQLALVLLAGPIAEGGHPRTAFGDYMEADTLLKYLSGKSGQSQSTLWRPALTIAALMVEAYETEIFTVAAALERRRRIVLVEPDILATLASANASRDIPDEPSPELAAMIDRIVADIAELVP